MQLPRKMSAQNVMASISRTLGNRESKAPVANEVRFAGDERKDKLYEPKHKQKLVRVLTVVAYVIFVSMAAILLSLYYTFLWDPKDLSVKMRVNKQECADIKLPDSLTVSPISNETQIERMTTRSTAVTKEESPPPTISTQRTKDFLTILTETTSAGEVSPSLSPTSYENFRIDPSSTTEYRVENAS
ncbi:hypothetical protein KM043_001941 [Ampulex compressa]|nr:hypothetical protein KM043_001941 [Ampulex compressa]